MIKLGLLSINRSVMIKWCFGLLCRQYTIWENTMAGHAWPSNFPMSFFEEVWGKKSWNMPLKYFFTRSSHYNYPTYKPHIWLKCPLLQKGANHLLLQKEVFP